MAPHILQDSLDDLISKEAVHTLLQPIVDMRHNRAVGYEALTRGTPGHLLQRPDLMFQAAHQFERIPDLEVLCIRSAIRHFAALDLAGLLFLNICPQTLLTYAETLFDLTLQLEQAGLTPADVVLEVSERFPIENTERFVQVITYLKELGYGIAIDDLGSGYSGLKLWSQIQPDFVKIDRHFIDRVDQDTVKQAFVTSVVHLCEQLQCDIIAEGIEQVGEMNLLRTLGIHTGQGFLLGRPQSQPEITPPQSSSSVFTQGGHILDQQIGQLCQSAMTIHSSMKMLDAEALFESQACLMSVPVLEDNRPVGLLHRRRLLEIFAQPYGRALYERKTVQQAMQQDPLIVDCSMTIEAVSKIMTDDEDHYLRQHLIVTDKSRYLGIVNTKDLLKRITENQIQKARYANPLTLLPGNVPIDGHIDSLISEHRRFYLLYADLNYFKPFNDHYGYRQGDQVLRWLGKLLQQFGNEQRFIGHIGGDDFVIISEEDNAQALCSLIMQAFEAGIAAFHTPDDWQHGYLSGTDRNGKPSQFPLLSLAIGVVPSELIGDDDPQTLAELAALAKKYAKQKGRNHWHCLSLQDSPIPFHVSGSA
ncbi:MAG: GGDEF domain-containing protein [Pseudomonadota bacterium]|nr:GGDEF domain-containing protein [Pseudomonadota bacterium]